MTRLTWLGLLLAVLAAMTGLIVWWLRPAPLAPVPSARADYLLEGYEMLALRKDGREGFSVRGPRLSRDVEGQEITLSQPVFSLPGHDGQRWTARSDNAVVNADQTEVRLQGGVEIHDEAPDASTRFDSDSLVIYPERDVAESADAVTLRQRDSILQGRGLTVDLAKKTYVLQNDVQARLAGRRPAGAGGP